MTAPTHQVYVTVDGGIANAFATAGDVDIIEVDWDGYDDLSDYQLEDLLYKRRQLENIVDPTIRTEALDSIDEIIANYRLAEEDEARRDAERAATKIATARAILEAEGYRLIQPGTRTIHDLP